MKATIEMPMGTKNKYELKDGKMTIDRVLTIPVPVNYGFVNNTLAEDGDALDIFVISKKLYNPGEEIEVDILGIFFCKDQGTTDDKLFAIDKHTKLTYENKLSHMCQVGHYLLNYKPGFKVLDYKSLTPKESKDILERYQK